jgi:hypothetical protein
MLAVVLVYPGTVNARALWSNPQQIIGPETTENPIELGLVNLDPR